MSEWKNIIVVPCYNKAARLCTSAFREFARGNRDSRVLFVDDCSVDGTQEVLHAMQREMGTQISILSLPKNMGKSEAVRVGMEAALAENPLYAGYWDADLATPLDAIIQFRAVLEQHPKVLLVLGSRVRLLGHTIRRSLFRHCVGRVFATAASMALRLPVYDTQCGAKLFRAVSPVSELFSEPFMSRWAFDVEIIARLMHRNQQVSSDERMAQFYEFPLRHWEDVAGSKVRAMDFPRSMLDLFRIRQRYLRASEKQIAAASGDYFTAPVVARGRSRTSRRLAVAMSAIANLGIPAFFSKPAFSGLVDRAFNVILSIDCSSKRRENTIWTT